MMLPALTRRFLSDAKGAAAVEFALILPLMLLVYIGTMEASALISMDRKVQSVTGALGDLVARTRDSIDEDTLRDYFQAASGIMTPFSTAGLEQVVTQVYIDASGDVTVDWSRQYIDGDYAVGDDHEEDEAFTLPAEMITVAGNDNYVIVAETRFAYTPLVGIVFDAPINLYRENFYVPRFGGSIQVAP